MNLLQGPNERFVLHMEVGSSQMLRIDFGQVYRDIGVLCR